MKKFDFIRLFAQALFVMAVVMLAACGDDVPLAPVTPAEEVEEPAAPSEELEPEEPFDSYFKVCDKKINQAVNDFSMELFRAMINDDEITTHFPNATISPISISYALAMAANTFDAQFASEVLSKLQSDDVAQLNMYFRRLMANQPEGDALKLANSAWYFDGRIIPSKSYVSSLAKAYSAPVNPIDFSNTNRAAEVINGWFADNTDKLIDKIVEPNDLEYAIVVLANALIFDCKWQYEFDEKLTKKDVFHGKNGDAELDFLNIKEHFKYYEVPKAKVISLPFLGTGYDLMIFIPNDGETFSSVVDGLDRAAVSKIEYEMADCIVDLSIPKFSSELNEKCTDLIESLGIQMKRPQTLYGFTGDEFTEYVNQISEVHHAAKMSINEKGALAASATALVSWSGGLPEPYEPQKVKLKIDRPFLYLLRDRTYDNIIIAGCYTQP